MKNIFAVSVTIAILISSASIADDKTVVDPFDTRNADANQYDISRLNCDDYRNLLVQKSPQLFPVDIWMYGVVSGMQGKIVPYSSKTAMSMMLLGVGLCKNKHKEKLSDLLLGLKRQIQSNSNK